MDDGLELGGVLNFILGGAILSSKLLLSVSFGGIQLHQTFQTCSHHRFAMPLRSLCLVLPRFARFQLALWRDPNPPNNPDLLAPSLRDAALRITLSSTSLRSVSDCPLEGFNSTKQAKLACDSAARCRYAWYFLAPLG